MAQALINIDGVVKDANDVTFPSTGREFRGAWQFNGDVIEIDMVKAVDIKITKIIEKANERVQKAEAKALEKALKGLDSTPEDDEIAKFKSKPKAEAVALIANAATPEELDAITEDQVFA